MDAVAAQAQVAEVGHLYDVGQEEPQLVGRDPREAQLQVHQPTRKNKDVIIARQRPHPDCHINPFMPGAAEKEFGCLVDNLLKRAFFALMLVLHNFAN